MGFFAAAAFGTGVSPLTGWAVGGAVAAALYVLGFLPFGRVQVGQGASGRVFPLRPGLFEYALAGLVEAMLAIGLIWLASRVLGNWGILAGLLLVAGGVLVSVAGYFAERAVSGLALISTLALALGASVLVAAFSVLRTSVLALAAALAWLLNVILSLLAAPVVLAIRAWRASRQANQPPAAANTSTAPEETRAA